MKPSKIFGASYRTSALGIVTILAAVFPQLVFVLDSDPNSKPNIELVIAGVTAGLGLLFARDNKVSSEEANK